MEPKERMRNSIHLVLENVRRIQQLSRSVRDEVNAFSGGNRDGGTISTMREQLCEIQSRLEGIEEFMLACEQSLEKQAEQEIEFWL